MLIHTKSCRTINIIALGLPGYKPLAALRVFCSNEDYVFM